MANIPLITIITPFLDTEAYIAEAIESVLAQTFSEWELVLVDDGSKDESSRIALTYAAQYPDKIMVVEHPGHVNRGISASRNLGRRHARGRWIASLDSDDVWVPTKLAEQMAIASEDPDVKVIMGASRYWSSWDGHSSLAGDTTVLVGAPADAITEPPHLLCLLYPLGTGAAPSMNTVLVRTDVIDRVGGWEESFRTGYEDQAFLSKLYLETPVYVSSKCWDLYRQRPGSCSKVDLIGSGYHVHRLCFLEWYEAYLDRRGFRGAAVWIALQRALRPYRHPVSTRFEMLGRRVLKRLSGMRVE